MTCDILVFLAGLLWGMIGLSVRKLGEYGFGSLEISALRWSFAAVFIALFALCFCRERLRIRLRDASKFAAAGIFGTAAMSAFLCLSMEYVTIAVADVLLYTAPVFVMIASVFFLGEKFSARKGIAILLAVSGCALVCGIVGENSVSLPGILSGIMSGVCYASYSVIGKFILRDYDALTLTVWTTIFAGIASLFLISPVRTVGKLAASPKAIIFVLMISVVCTLLPFALYSAGLKKCPASRAAVLSCTEPVAAAVFGAILGEKISVFQIIGVALVISGILTITINKKGN